MNKIQTPPQFIWTILQKHPTVKIIKAGKEKMIKYKVPEFESVPDGKCWLCGGDTDGIGLLKKRRITKMFSDTEFAQFPASQSLCTGCGGLLSNASMRFYSLFASVDGVAHPTRLEWRDILLQPPGSPWTGGLSISGQKHLFYKVLVNYQNNECVVALEDYLIIYKPGNLKEALTDVERMLEVFTKEEVRTGRYRHDRVRTYGLSAWQEDESKVETTRGTPFLELVLYIAKSEKIERQDEPKKQINPDTKGEAKCRMKNTKCNPSELQLTLLNFNCQH